MDTYCDILTGKIYRDVHGTYDRHGNFSPQTVGLGVVAYTQQPGLFTGGYLAMPISWEDHAMLREAGLEAARDYVAKRWRFILVHL